MTHRESADYEDVPRMVVGIGSDHTTAIELAEHAHRRGQLLYAASGVVTVSTPHGAWIAPPERGVWIPGGTPHAVRTIGAVQFRCILIEPSVVTALGSTCKVLAITPLLKQLLVKSAEIEPEYDEEGHDGLIMRLLVSELNAAIPVPLAVPFPTHPALSKLCRAFLKAPNACDTIDKWAAEMSIDRRRFTRLFRRETGMSFMEWRQQACLLVALPRLAAGDSITTIAFDLGYGSTAAFSTMFRRSLGVPPSAYTS